MMAARSDKAVGRVYYITSPSSCFWEELVAVSQPALGFKKLYRVSLPKPFVYLLSMVIGSSGLLSGKPPLLNRDKANELVQDYWVCSPERAMLDIGFTAGTTLAEGVAKTICWYRRKGWL